MSETHEKLAIHGGTPLRTAPFPRREPFGEREVELVSRALRSQDLFYHSGSMGKELERRFAEAYGAKHAVVSSSGTAAIHVAVGVVNPSPGEEIITAPITDAGTVVPILYQNAIPVFADVDSSYCMDPADVEARITPRTRAILVVHLFGNACDIEAMADIARRHDLALIEDCSQAHMTEHRGRLLGQFGQLAAFSLQQSKHMTTGDGGVTLCNDERLARRMQLFVDKGWARRPGWGARVYELLAPNYRMTELQAAVGLAQLEKVSAVVRRRNELGTRLTEGIREISGIVAPPVTPGTRHSYWLYALEVQAWEAGAFARALSAEGVPAGAGYIGDPIFLCMAALSDRRTFGSSGYPLTGVLGRPAVEYRRGMCPRTERALSRMVTLTLHEGYSERDVEDMAAAVGKVARLLERRASGPEA